MAADAPPLSAKELDWLRDLHERAQRSIPGSDARRLLLDALQHRAASLLAMAEGALAQARKPAGDDVSDTIERRLLTWLTGDNTGSSSRTMVCWLYGLPLRDRSHPHDGGDLGRCIGLLDAIPEWRTRVREMAAVSPYWAALVPRWSKLERMWRTNRRDLKPYEPYEFMRALLRPVEDADSRVVRLAEGVTLTLEESTP